MVGCVRPVKRLTEETDCAEVRSLGYVPLLPGGAELLFEVFSQRCERGSVLVRSNLPFEEWTSVFGSERLIGGASGPSDVPRAHPAPEDRFGNKRCKMICKMGRTLSDRSPPSSVNS